MTDQQRLRRLYELGVDAMLAVPFNCMEWQLLRSRHPPTELLVHRLDALAAELDAVGADLATRPAGPVSPRPRGTPEPRHITVRP